MTFSYLFLFNNTSRIMSGRIKKAGKYMFKNLHIWGGRLFEGFEVVEPKTAAARK
jgi:hypothetical protein